MAATINGVGEKEVDWVARIPGNPVRVPPILHEKVVFCRSKSRLAVFTSKMHSGRKERSGFGGSPSPQITCTRTLFGGTCTRHSRIFSAGRAANRPVSPSIPVSIYFTAILP